MKSFKKYLTEKDDSNLKSISKKKHLLKHTVLIQAQEGDSVKGTKARINIKSLNDCNINGHVTFNTYEDAIATFERLTNLDEIVEFLQRNSNRFPTSTDWAYIVRDEIDKRDSLDPQIPQAPQAAMIDTEAEEEARAEGRAEFEAEAAEEEEKAKEKEKAKAKKNK